MSDRNAILRDSLAIGAATAAYGVSFGALAVAAGLEPLQAQALSGLMFTGASQFALVGVIGAGGGAIVAIATAAFLGARNMFYAFHMAPIFKVSGLRRLLAAHMTIDESTGMAMGHEDSIVNARTAFWSTGFAIFLLWNGGTLVGALGAGLLGDPARLGLDAAIPAAFLALMWPRLSTSVARVTAAVAIGLALVATPLLPAGVPVLLAGLSSVGVGLLYQRWRPARTPPTVLP